MNFFIKLLTFWIPWKETRLKLYNALWNLVPLEKNWVVFYDTFSPNGNGDSIRPIAQELRRRRPYFKFFFVSQTPKPIDMADEVLIEKSKRFKEICRRAAYLVSPMNMPAWKHRGQIFVYTGHGSPIKKVYLARDPQNRDFIEYAQTISLADIFLLQGRANEEPLKKCYGLKKKQLFQCGLPRNDVLFAQNDDLKKKLKLSLGLPMDKKIILYCPTWRRYDYKAVLPFNILKLKEKLSGEYVLLMRSHVGKHAWVNQNLEPVRPFDHSFVFDGSACEEVTYLYLIADVFISDYSSAIFDFSLTRKPQVLYLYDLKSYTKEFGLFFDVQTFSPFPTAFNDDELIRALLHLQIDARKYAAFCEKYCTYEDGKSAVKVVDYMLSEETRGA